MWLDQLMLNPNRYQEILRFFVSEKLTFFIICIYFVHVIALNTVYSFNNGHKRLPIASICLYILRAIACDRYWKTYSIHMLAVVYFVSDSSHFIISPSLLRCSLICLTKKKTIIPSNWPFQQLTDYC